MCKRLLWAVATACAVGAAHPAHAAADPLTALDADLYLGILEALCESPGQFTAQVELEMAGGSDRARLARDLERVADWHCLNTQDFDDALFRLRRIQPLLQPFPEYQWRGRYVSTADGRMRFERRPPESATGGESTPGAAAVDVFDGADWYSYAPPNAVRGGELTITSSPQGYAHFEIARGGGIFLERRLSGPKTNFEITPTATVTRVLRWSDVVRMARSGTAAAKLSTFPTADEALPVLEVESPHYSDFGVGLFRIRLWFDLSQADSPRFAEAAISQFTAPGSGDRLEFIPTWSAEWSDPAHLAEGLRIYQTCVVHHYTQIQPVHETAQPADWPTRAYEEQRATIHLRDIVATDRIDDSLFKVVPATGTNVVNESTRLRFVVAPDGRWIEEEALQRGPTMRQRAPIIPATSLERRVRIALLMLNAVVLTAVLIVTFIRRRRTTTPR